MSDADEDQTSRPPFERHNSRPEEEYGANPQAVEQWFDALPHDEDTPTDREERALRDFLTGKTSAQVAAKELTADAAQSNAPDGEIYRIWSFINEAAVDLPGAQEKLIDLLGAIQQLPDAGRGKSAVSWKDLPQFSYDIRDRWDCQ